MRDIAEMFDHPQVLAEEIVSAIETDPQVKVVVFESAVEGFFITHYDFLAPLEKSARIPPGYVGMMLSRKEAARLLDRIGGKGGKLRG